MHNGIQNLKLVLYVDNHPVETIFEEIIDRMPNLSNLDINAYPIPEHFVEELSDMLQKLSNLSKVSLPGFCYSTQIFEALSHLQLLGTIEFYIDRMDGSLDSQSFPPVITAGAFSTLHNLIIPTDFLDVASWLKSPYTPSALINLTINSELVETPDSICKLAFQFQSTCRS